MHPSSAWILMPELSDRCRVTIAALQRYGCHNRPTILHVDQLRALFADGKGYPALLEAIDRGALRVTGLGDGHLVVEVLDAPLEVRREIGREYRERLTPPKKPTRKPRKPREKRVVH